MMLCVGTNRDENFSERFNRLTRSLSDSDLAKIMDMSLWGVRKLRTGETQSIKLEGALRLCRHIGVTPWDLAGFTEELKPEAKPAVESELANLRTAVIDLAQEFRDATSAIDRRLVALEGDRSKRQAASSVGAAQPKRQTRK